MTEIDAINKMLRYIGELPIPNDVAIDNLPEGHEAIIARSVLKETIEQTQEDRWWFNQATINLIPNTDGYISMPPNIISIYSNSKYLIIGNDLFDVSNQTKIFTSPVRISVLLSLKFEDLPKIVRTYVVLLASKSLHTSLNGDETTQAELDKEILTQKYKVDRENTRQSKVNLIKNGRLLDRTSNPSLI